MTSISKMNCSHKFKLKTKNIRSVFKDTALVNKLMSLTFEFASEMRQQMRYISKQLENNNPVDGKIIMAIKNDEVIGWALLHQNSSRGVFIDKILMIYVNPKNRNRGIGTIIINKAKTIDTGIKVFPHNTISSAFFEKNKKSIIRIKYGRLARG